MCLLLFSAAEEITTTKAGGCRNLQNINDSLLRYLILNKFRSDDLKSVRGRSGDVRDDVYRDGASKKKTGSKTYAIHKTTTGRSARTMRGSRSNNSIGINSLKSLI